MAPCSKTLTLSFALGTALSPDALPGFIPSVAAGSGAQADHGIDVWSRPMHAASLQSRLHDELVRALDSPASDRIARGQELGIADLPLTLLQIAHRRVADVRSLFGP